MSNLIVILGAGESGIGSAILAKQKGFDVFISDNGKIKAKYLEQIAKHNILFEEGNHTLTKILKADEIIKSPGIPESAKIIKEIRKKGIPVISDIEFASRYTNAKTICITGSNGKTTTTLLIYHILKTAGLNVGLAGNVGKSFALEVAENNYEYFVIELSSFQLDVMYKFRADIAIILNITPDHLDRYAHKFQNYVNSKFRITQNQKSSDTFIYCYDDEVIMNEMKKRKLESQLIPFSIKTEVEKGGYVKDNKLIININNNKFTMSIQELALQGKHNQYNSLVAAISSELLRIRKDDIRNCLRDFQTVEHRLEKVLKVRGIEFINDSKATNINSTWYALETMKKPIIWIVGGTDKGNDYSQLSDLVKSKVKSIICLGLDNSKILKAFKDINVPILETKSMNDAVKSSYYLAKEGDVVLLSPACASFDIFENYEDRGKQFKKAVRDL
ncbi:MAG: UDP-N-acetylmuramoyl-L-alanine--D-glutamate ligase [Bacteroidetes bacterium CG02_land_8_20_14_3_00_31_25]|nr:UDP-N-acetylmuramoyl-L-alanine--D-glutamate ligase [Bacteroidota bacterium]PIV63247.1 MAG: UDP-N-acetylmuramoyl-L-alanine--D-glutamate ligase [Bacteroidetes bacterium CG02_land_8_20_14_3_00_31_25]PIY03560.1 MAG: UDP-N-acetylmuramoyl-L-alanine--D-glutamate ligase [Bacteroidetes bacterium CG_4_10_14_3_um_filter_31_20]